MCITLSEIRIDRNKKEFGNFTCFSRGNLFGKHILKVALAAAYLTEMAVVTFGHYWSARDFPIGRRPVSRLQFCTLVAIKPHDGRKSFIIARSLHCLLLYFAGDNTAAIQRQESSVAARWAGIAPGLLLLAVCLWVSR